MRLIMIDKVDLRVPVRAPYTREFATFRREIQGTERDPFRASCHYVGVADLRDFGYPAIHHSTCLHGREGTHKLELVDTGIMSLARMQHEAERIFDVDARRLGVMRLDLAADVLGVPVSWFSDHVRAVWKRWVADVGQVEVARMGKGEIQTIYFGKRLNCFRIYNKIAEWRHQYARLKRGTDAGYPSFKEVFRYPETGVVLTRVERQMGGGRIPERVSTFGKLRTLADFNPFDRLQFLGTGEPEPRIEDYGFEKYAIGMFLRDRAQSLGGHRLRSWLNRNANRNAGRILHTYHDFLPAEEGITPEQLLETYQQSVARQLAA